MDGVERVWATVILEHFLFICKLFVENIIPKVRVPCSRMLSLSRARLLKRLVGFRRLTLAQLLTSLPLSLSSPPSEYAYLASAFAFRFGS